MCILNIPHFKEVVTMAFRCEYCGFKSVEVKGAGGMGEQAKRLTCVVKDVQDLQRDVVKSDLCSVLIPEIELELKSGTLGSKLTSIEGLLHSIYKNLKENNPFSEGDSSVQNNFTDFL